MDRAAALTRFNSSFRLGSFASALFALSSSRAQLFSRSALLALSSSCAQLFFAPAFMEPPIFSHVPPATYLNSFGSLSFFDPSPAQACVPVALAQSLAPALATP